MNLVIMLHTHNPNLQRQIIAKDLSFSETLEQARASELTDRELARIKEMGTHIGANKIGVNRGQQGVPKKGATCIYCGGKFPHPKDEPCRTKTVTCFKCGKSRSLWASLPVVIHFN